MDPNDLLRQLVEALDRRDHHEASAYALGLARHIRRGGLLPRMSATDLDFILTVMAERLTRPPG